MRKRRRARRSVSAVQPTKQKSSPRRAEDSDISRYFPKLSQILESSEAKSEQPRRRTGDHRSVSTRYDRREDNTARKPYRTRSSGTQPSRRQESLLSFNASLLSVISGFTTATDRSSGSNSTLTQQSYYRSSDHHTRSTTQGKSTASKESSTYKMPFNVTMIDDHDAESSSSTSSQYAASDAGSSDAIGTPSSRSTFPSPTQSRGQHVAELRRKYDVSLNAFHQDYAPEDVAMDVRDPSGLTRRRSMMDRTSTSQHSEEQSEPLFMHSSHPPLHPTTYGDHYVDEMRRSTSAERAAQSALEPYQYSSMEHAPLDESAHHHLARPQDSLAHPPPAPDAPDISQKTVAGYEMLALELSSASSAIKPMYRKFEYLNHRLLLHLQDELAELEDQLRTVDEIIAQNEPPGKRSPQSRRYEQQYGAEIHHHRTNLLGRIFQKTEQYNKAMSSYSGMLKNAGAAKSSQVRAYQEWMALHRPVHELESIFLWRENDLIVPASDASQKDTASLSFVMSHSLTLVAGTMVTIAMIPTVLSRLIVLTFAVVSAITVVLTTKLGSLLPLRDWLICFASYTILMLATACAVPQKT